MDWIIKPISNIPLAACLPGKLYIGSVSGTKQDYLEANGINVVVSLHEPHPLPLYVQNYRFSILDDPKEEPVLSSIIKKMVPRIHYHLVKGDNVLVHCRAGMQRAPSLVVHYLMHYEKLTQEGAIEKIRTYRPIAFLNGYTFF
jgi:atypical dual specificity phosphatase